MTTDAESWERERLLEALDSYKRGLSEAPYLRKWADKATHAASGQDAMTFVASTDDLDRQGDTISVNGWHLQAYMRNPVFLWAHAYYRPAIGRATEIWKENHSLLARIDFAPTDFAQEVATIYRGGYQRGVSVGFRPLQYEIRRDTKTGEFLGINFIQQELLEISAPPVPANQNALRKALDGTPRLRSYYYHCGLGEQGDLSSITWEQAFEEILAALKGARQ